MAGILSIVATPIGNLEDMTYRAVRVLKEADLIASEDTRHTRKLLDHYGIDKPTISYHEHNELDRAADLIGRLQGGSNIALVTDAGTPLIADPGYRVVSQAAAAGLTVISIPGACALVTALAGSGLPTDSFFFGGFLPARRTQRRRALEEAGELPSTIAFYEAPHRIREALADVVEVLGDREVVVCRELTKLHEEWARGTASVVAAKFEERVVVKGEITLLIGRGKGGIGPLRSVQEAFAAYLGNGLSRMDAIKAVAKERGASKREVYAELEAESD